MVAQGAPGWFRVTQEDLWVQGDLGRLRSTQYNATQRQPGRAGVPSLPKLVPHRDESRVAPRLWRPPAVGPFVLVLCGPYLFAPASLWRYVRRRPLRVVPDSW